MPKAPSEIRLARLELQIMNVVWDKEKATVYDVKEALSQGRKPAYSTILTMMRNLETKGYLAHDVDDRTYVYRPLVSRQTARRGMLRDLLERLFEGSPSLLMSSLVEETGITEEELHEIRKLLGRRRKQNE